MGLMNNSKAQDGLRMVGSAAWLSYPISLYDTTKMNFTLNWNNYSCPQSVTSIVNCSPQGGFALVFQQESQTALGEYLNNLGEGLGYDGLSGLIAIEFDMYASVHKNQTANKNLMINVQIKNPNTQLLTTKFIGNLAYDTSPVNFATGFSSSINVSVGIIPNQLTRELVFILLMDGYPQLTISATFEEIGLDATKVYYAGFTSTQNLNSQAATGTLNILNYRMFKTKPKFVDGQVSYLYEYVDTFGNMSQLEIRSSFYDLCMQKTTLIVYPTVSISDWQNSKELEPHILPFLYDNTKDTFVTGSYMPPLAKSSFYKPSQLYLTPDVKFQVSVPTGMTTGIRMGFYYSWDLIMNITAIDYFRTQKNLNFAFIVIDNSDLITGALSTQGYVDSTYQFTVACYDKQFNSIAVQLSQIYLTVTSDYIRLNGTTYSNIVPLTCYASSTSKSASSDPTKSQQWTCTFLPNINGTYYINSPYLPSGRSFSISIGQADTALNILSSEYSQAIVLGDFAVTAGSTVEIYIDQRDYLNQTYNLSPDDGCSFTNSYYYQNGIKYSFLFYDDYPYLRTQITKAGVADFKIRISCTRTSFDLQCYRCQKYVEASSTYYYYNMAIPSYPSDYDISIDSSSNLMLYQGNNLVIDLTYYDRYDNMVDSELDSTYLANIKMSLVYSRTGKSFELQQMQVPGKVMMYLSDADSTTFKSLTPRTSLYSLSIQAPSQYACNSVDKYSKDVFIVSQDKVSPMEFVGDSDTTVSSNLLATVYWDRIIESQKVSRFHFTVRNANMLQLNTWLNFSTDLIEGKIQDNKGTNQITSGNCNVKLGYGLYEGEYFGWFYCTYAPRFNNLIITFNNTNLTGAMPFYTVSSDPSTVDKNLQQSSFTSTLTLQNSGLSVTFKLTDDASNAIETVLIKRNQPQLGLITYNLTKIDTGVVMRYNSLPMVNTSGFFKIDIDNFPIGTYRLQLNIPEPISLDITFNSISSKVSPIYSYAYRENGSQTSVSVSSYITLRFYAANIHNSTIDKNADSQLLTDQCRVYLTSSNGLTIMMDITGTFADKNGVKYYNYTTIQPLTKNGVYFTNIYFVDTQEYMNVVNGTFKINDNFEPSVSELYLVKGINQDEYRMIKFETTASATENANNASFYDPRIDGSLRLKMYFRTNFNYEIINNADFTNVVFRNAYLGYATLQNNQYALTTNLTNISLTIKSINGEYLLIVPNSWSDQDKIESLVEGYYFIYVNGFNYGNFFTLQWMFTMFNSDNGPQLTNQALTLFAPKFVNITAGVPFTFTAAVYGGVRGPAYNTLTRVASTLQSVDIEKTSNNTPAGYIFYITVYHNKTGTFYLQLSATTPTKNITIEVNPAPLYQLSLVSSSMLSQKTATIGTQIAFNFTLLDRFGNNILGQTNQKIPLKKIEDLMQIYHQSRSPVIKYVRQVTSTIYQCNFTTYQAGIVSFIAPLNNATATSAVYYNITFSINSKEDPSEQYSYATLKSTEVTAGTSVSLEVNLFDAYENKLTTTTFTSSQFLVNVVPDNICNATSYMMTFSSQKGGVVTFSANITKACLYQVYVYFFSTDNGQLNIPCLNCYLNIQASSEDASRIDFLDARDMLINVNSKQSIYLGKNDRSPKIIMIFRDSYDNLITSNYSDFTSTYKFDIVPTGSTTVMMAATINSYRSFHYLSFCNNEDSQTNACFNSSTYSSARLRIIKYKKNTSTVQSTSFITVNFNDNYGVKYNADSINPIAANYSYMRILNQDMIDGLGYDLPPIYDSCMGGDRFPIIGRIDLKTTQGFRRNESFSNLTDRLTLQITNLSSSKYSYQMVSGSTQGIVLFALFLKDDHFNDQLSSTAKLYIDGVEFTNRPIQVSCERRNSYTKYFIANNGSLLTSPETTTITAGSILTLNITGADPLQQSVTKFLPYDSKIFINYTNNIYTNGKILALNDVTNQYQSIRFYDLRRAGSAQIIGSYGLDPVSIVISPGIISADYSQVQIDSFKITAGQNSTVYISPADKYGNAITLTNTSSDISYFNSYSQVYYAKLDLFDKEFWQIATCSEVSSGRMKCTQQLTEKGLYKWKVVIRGEIAQCISCFLRVVPTGKIQLSNTVMTDLSQNFYANPYFGIGKFNIFPRSNYIYMKLYLKDEYENSYINEESLAVVPIWPVIRVNGKDANLTLTRQAAGIAHNSIVYKLTVQQTSAQLTAFSIYPEGTYQIRLVTNTLGTQNMMIYILSNKTSSSYPSVAGTLTMKFKESNFMFTAGKNVSIQFEIADSSTYFIQSFNTNQTFSYSIPLQSGIAINGDQIIGKYRGFYERFLKIANASSTKILPTVYQQQYIVQVDGFNQGGETKFTTTVYPNDLTKITYQNGSQSFKAYDAYGNDLDYPYESGFNLQTISVRSVPVLLNNFTNKLNYTSRFGVIYTAFDPFINFTTLALVDSTLNTYNNPFTNYSTKNVIDYDKSYYTVNTYYLVAGKYIQVKVYLLDSYYQTISIFNNTIAQSNLTVQLLNQNLVTLKSYNFTGVNVRTGALTLNLQVTMSGYYYIKVQYYNTTIDSFYGDSFLQWIYVTEDPDPGYSQDQQWTISMTAIQRNKMFSPLSYNGTDYVTFMKTQPLFFLARLCDRWGNPFQQSSYYSYYNVGDTALSARIKNYGDTRSLSINTQIVWNVMTVSVTNTDNRALYERLLPSYFPLVNNNDYNNYESYKVDIYSPSNSTANVYLKVLYLVLTSDSTLDVYHSGNVSSSQKLSSTGIVSNNFYNNQIQLRQSEKQLITVAITNSDSMAYLAESISNFSVTLTNTTTKTVYNSATKKNETQTVTLDTVKIQIVPFHNEAYFRIYFYSTTLYQDTYPLQARASIKTSYTYNSSPLTVDIPLWVFPQTPPDYINPIVNTTFLAKNQTKFTPATKITFNLTLKYNNTQYYNDYQSANQIKIYRKGSLEQVTASLYNKTVYQIAVNLEGASTNEFRIYYQDFDGALYPLTSPQVIQFQINTASTTLSSSLYYSKEELYDYPKLGSQWRQPLKELSYYREINQQLPILSAFDIKNLQIVLISNLFNSTYNIGNYFRTAILIVDNQTSRCLASTDYDPYTSISARIQSYDPITKTKSRISIDVEYISLVLKVVSSPTSYCAYYSVAVFESTTSLSTQGNYSLTVSFQNTLSANLTFQAQVSGIDFSKTQIGWYSTTSNTEQLIAEFNAYEEFNYLIYFLDVQGNYVSERVSSVKIQLKFDQQKLTEDTDYKYISRYDDRYKGYLITVQFFKSGSFQPEYYFNLQRADNIQVTNGPVLFVVKEPKCMSIKILSSSGTKLSIGQLFTFVFYCYDANNKEITDSIAGLKSNALFSNLQMKNQRAFGTIEVLQNGLYRVTNKFYIEGVYTLKIYFNNLLIYQDNSKNYTITSDLCKDFTGLLMYKCPDNPSVCANNYYECNYINSTKCSNPSYPFQCGDKCVSNMASECCKINDRSYADYKWCPHTNMCVNTTTQSCPTLNSSTPLYCKSLNKFVRYRHECCGDYSYNVTVYNGTNITFVQKNMTKCSYENKCVPEDTAQYCFQSYIRTCSEIFGSEFSYQCRNDGKCKRNSTECPSPRVCPPGYTQCPDYTCIRGLDKFSSCNKLQNCTKTLPDGSQVEYIRCPDGTCSRTYDDCPSLISCMSDQVVCPDGSCKNSELECVQPNECTSDYPYKCPGFPSTCARTKNECPMPAAKSCGSFQALCADGSCSSSCKASNDYKYMDKNTGLVSISNNCGARGLVQCPNYECRNSYVECSDILYCPIPLNYTYSPSAVICPAARTCALQRQDCSYSQCESSLNTIFEPKYTQYLQVSTNQINLETCYDGRCYKDYLMKQDMCMTPISCSVGYFKAGGFGEFCVSSITIANQSMELSVLLNDYKCPKGKVKCVSGECRNSFDDCPSQITCPAELPIQCRDGQCAKSKSICNQVDVAVEANLLKCYAQGMLLCTSDLVTCTKSLSNCPSRATCPIGFIKCWDESCVNPETQSCPTVSDFTQNAVISTCPFQFSYPFHCYADGSCRTSLSDCPSISFCPSDRPVKCPDKSCRTSVKNCPQNTDCPAGYKFCSGEGTCVPSNSKCGTPATCTTNRPYLCEDGTCVNDLKLCSTKIYTLTDAAITCIQDNQNYLCQNNKTLCTQNLSDCPSSTTCIGSHLVKSFDSGYCYQSRNEFSTALESLTEDNYACYLSNMYRCSNGQCSSTPCPEWNTCSNSNSPNKCWDGLCVSNATYCNVFENGCPFYAPIKCNYTGNCVANTTNACGDDQMNMQNANKICKTKYNLNYACKFDGSCTNNTLNCPTQSTKYCMNSYGGHEIQYQNTNSCYIPQCPEEKPYKCQNGLCVDSTEKCPLNIFSTDEINYCQALSMKQQADIKVPCGNGQCMQSSDQCPPLYECSSNLNSQAFYRCNDGTCREKSSDCSQSYSSCPLHIPYMCSNGMCAKTEDDCISNENGCPQRTPYKCKYTGQCMNNSDSCYDPVLQMTQLFVYPNYIPQVTSTPLIAFYGTTRSYCQSKGQFTCRINSDFPLCVDRLDDCKNTDTDCPVNKPIRCGNSCITKYLDCQNDTCTTSRCEASGGCLTNTTTCSTSEGCSTDSSFKCSSLSKTCGTLPYTSFPQLYSSTCKATERQIFAYSNIFNDCANSEAPYSCANGKCVSDINLCPTCIFYCTALKKCVSNQSECTNLQPLVSKNDQFIQGLSQSCPLDAPNRCILTGRCVANELSCARDQAVAFKLSYNYSYTGSLINEKCPFKTPISCQNGKCVSSYDECIKTYRKKYSSTSTINPYKYPQVWGIMPNFTLSKIVFIQISNIDNSTCQVICQDGSCRDRVENCPMIQGCYDLSKPYRCRSGFCAKDKDQCYKMFGNLETEDPSYNTSSSSCYDSSDSTQQYIRCEDGTCRPLFYNEQTKKNQTSCLPYMGCPITAPYHCSTGECVTNMDSCAGASQCPTDKPFRCKNYKCVEQMNDCERPQNSYSALQIDRTINLLEESWISFAYSITGITLGKLYIPSNAITLTTNQTFSSQMQTFKSVRTYPVPDSVLELIVNQIPTTRTDYISKIYPLTSEGYLNRALSLLSPAVKIETDSSLDLNQAYIYFKIDNESFPQVLNMEQDICLGKVFNMEYVYKSQSLWQCQERSFNKTDDGYLQFPIRSLGTYAVIINPNPDYEDGTTGCGFICLNHRTLLIIQVGLITLIVILVYAICICRRQRPYNENKTRDTTSQFRRGSLYQGKQEFYQMPFKTLNKYLAQILEKFYTPELVKESDVELLKEQLDSIDPSDPPLMPGQVVMYLTQQHDTQKKQIEVLKNQLQEYQEKEINNLSLIKAIFDKNKVLQAQMDLEKELRSNTQQTKSVKSRKPKRVKEDPSIMTEYNQIDAYLAQQQSKQNLLMMDTNRQMSAATFEQYPAGNQSMMKQLGKHTKLEDQSLQSIPLNQIYGGSNMIISESTRDLINKNYQSTSNLLTNQDNQRNMLIRDDDFDEFQFNEMNKRRTDTFDEQQLHSIEEEKDADEQSLLNKRYKIRAINDSNAQDFSDIKDNMTQGIDPTELSKTLNSLFQNTKGRGQGGEKDTKGFNMFMASEGISGTKSGNLIKSKDYEQDVTQKYQDLVNQKVQRISGQQNDSSEQKSQLSSAARSKQSKNSKTDKDSSEQKKSKKKDKHK